jgi:uncharacterized protein (TIGR03437 family)
MLRAMTSIMYRKLCSWLALLGAAASMVTAQTFLLGVNNSKQAAVGSLINIGNLAAASDSTGNLYVLAEGVVSLNQMGFDTSYVLKLTPSGKDIVYQTQISFEASVMAVDPAGDVYLIGYAASGLLVEKLGTDGKTAIYLKGLGQNLAVRGIAADDSGRLYLAGSALPGQIQTTKGAFQETASGTSSHAFVIRLNASGDTDYATYLGGSGQDGAALIAVDSFGSAFAAGETSSTDFPVTPGAYLTTPPTSGAAQPFLARLSPNGSGLVYSTFMDTQGLAANGLAVDSADNAVVALSPGIVVMRFSPKGSSVVFSKLLPGNPLIGLAVDGKGNAYVATFTSTAGYPVKNSLVSCEPAGSATLTVLDSNGNLLQSTYLAGPLNDYAPPPALAVLPDSTVNLVGWPETTYSPPQQPSTATSGTVTVTQLSPNENAKTVQLACVGNSASFDPSAISPGELVSLFGDGLGPATGMEPEVTMETGFPAQLGNVRVTFNGTPGPLLYVQDGQINAIVPWTVQTGQSVQVCVTYNGLTTNCMARPGLPAHPGVFTVDGYHAAALNQDGTVNSAANPAKPNSIVSIFATGLGPISPPQPDGSIIGLPLPENALPVQIYTVQAGIGGSYQIPITSFYSGPAPFEVAGVTQINFTVTSYAYVQVDQVSGNSAVVYVAAAP